MNIKHIKLECKTDCDNSNCNTCNLFTCSVCGCSEGELPSDCPGYRVEAETRENIYTGKLDYKDGTWWERTK